MTSDRRDPYSTVAGGSDPGSDVPVVELAEYFLVLLLRVAKKTRGFLPMIVNCAREVEQSFRLPTRDSHPAM